MAPAGQPAAQLRGSGADVAAAAPSPQQGQPAAQQAGPGAPAPTSTAQQESDSQQSQSQSQQGVAEAGSPPVEAASEGGDPAVPPSVAASDAGRAALPQPQADAQLALRAGRATGSAGGAAPAQPPPARRGTRGSPKPTGSVVNVINTEPGPQPFVPGGALLPGQPLPAPVAGGITPKGAGEPASPPQPAGSENAPPLPPPPLLQQPSPPPQDAQHAWQSATPGAGLRIVVVVLTAMLVLHGWA